MKQHRNSTSSKSLMELEGLPVREPMETDTPLVQSCLRLMRIPLEQLTTENLRQLIAQQIGLIFLIPLALDRLEPDAFAAGDLYEGDLLHAVVRAPPTFWAAEPQLRSRLDHVVMNLKDRIRFLERDIFPNYERIYAP
jgi:hypothetical protein